MTSVFLFSAGFVLLSQTQVLNHGDPSRGVTLPPTSAALVNEAPALAINPAALSQVGAGQLVYVHDRNSIRDSLGNGLFAAATLFDALGVGVALEWLRGQGGEDYRKSGVGISLGRKDFSVGATFNRFSSTQGAALDNLSSIDLGVSVQQSRHVSLGFLVRNVDLPQKDTLQLERQYQLALGLRPFGDRHSVAIDYLVDEAQGLRKGRLGYTLQSRLLKGVTLLGGVAHRLSNSDEFMFQVGVTLDTSQLGLSYASGGSTLGNSHVLAARLSSDKYPSVVPTRGTVALFDLDRLLSDGNSTLSLLLGGQNEDPWLRLTRLFEEVAEDEDLRGVVLKVDGLGIGLARALELREAILRMKKQGKAVYAVVLSASDADYLAVSAADKILVTPGSVLQLDGLTASATFVGEAMEKLGVQWEVARVGAYKNAPDTFTRSTMSGEQREAINAYLDTDFRVYMESVTASRKVTEAQFKEGLNEGLKSPARALELKWVDEIINPQALDEKLKAWLPAARFDANYVPRGLRETRWGNRPKIALIPVIGNITGGRSRQDPFGFSQSAGAETVVRALKQAEEDPSIEAIVLRIDSGGGDTLASELMYRAVLEARKKKPVIASMGDVAASGGYYVAMGADTVFAQSTTVTGSIGVFFIKPAVAGLASKLGIRNETIKRGERAGMLGLFEPWSSADRTAAQKWVDSFYDTFISEVARCRKLSKEQVDAVARGRVWAGQDALARGLLDRLGGLPEAIALARQKAQIAETESVDLVILQAPTRLFTGASVALAQALREDTPEPVWQKWARQMGLDLTEEPETGMLARMEFHLQVQ